MQPVQPPEHDTSSSISGRSARLSAARYGIGGVMVLAAVVVLVVVPGDIGFTSAMAYGVGSALAAGLSVLLINAVVSVVLLKPLYRWSALRDRDREGEGDASRYLDGQRAQPGDDELQEHQLTHRCVVARGAVPAEQEPRADRAARGDRLRVPVPGER